MSTAPLSGHKRARSSPLSNEDESALSESSCLCSRPELSEQEDAEPSPHSQVFSAGCYRGTSMPVQGWFAPCRRCRVWTAHTVSVVAVGGVEDVSCCKRCEVNLRRAKHAAAAASVQAKQQQQGGPECSSGPPPLAPRIAYVPVITQPRATSSVKPTVACVPLQPPTSASHSEVLSRSSSQQPSVELHGLPSLSSPLPHGAESQQQRTQQACTATTLHLLQQALLLQHAQQLQKQQQQQQQQQAVCVDKLGGLGGRPSRASSCSGTEGPGDLVSSGSGLLQVDGPSSSSTSVAASGQFTPYAAQKEDTSKRCVKQRLCS